jgi:hypothetical protein
MKFKTVLLILLLSVSSAAQTTKKPKLPLFEDFPVAERWAGSHAKVLLDTPAVRMFRTQFRDAALKPPNFAGHYRITTWGCGTLCFEGGMVDLATGKVIALPASARNRGSEYWMLCYSAFVPSGIESRADSHLLIVRCADIIGRDGGSHVRASYFVFENESFQKIAEQIGTERVF